MDDRSDSKKWEIFMGASSQLTILLFLDESFSFGGEIFGASPLRDFFLFISGKFFFLMH